MQHFVLIRNPEQDGYIDPATLDTWFKDRKIQAQFLCDLAKKNGWEVYMVPTSDNTMHTNYEGIRRPWSIWELT